MTLHAFLDATHTAGQTEIRRAMTAALAHEVPRDHDGYTRFYRRVIDHVDAGRRDPRHPVCARLTPAA